MSQVKCLTALSALALLATLGSCAVKAQEIKTVFVIALENHNWTQPDRVADKKQPLYGNPNAPFINSLVNGSAVAMINGSRVNISGQVAYATAYHNVLATPSGDNPHIHPSEPNYIWAEAGDNLGVSTDNDPYQAVGGTNQNTRKHLSALLTQNGKTWRSYQEDIDLVPFKPLSPDITQKDKPTLTNKPLSPDMWTVPLASFSGFFAGSDVNAFNGSNQFSYAAKHNPMVFFSDTNGGNVTPANKLARHYAPLQQLMTDLANNTVADYNWITPDMYNDMHTALTGGYKGLTGDASSVRQGDDFLSRIVPVIMKSEAYQNGGVIIIWCDEAEKDGAAGDNPDDFNHTIPEIIISPRARRNVNGHPYASPVNLSHSSDLRTMQEIFHAGPLLGDAANATDLSDLFEPGAIPEKP